MNDDEEEWTGVATHEGRPFTITGNLGEFILDYASYDPAFVATGDMRGFRDGLVTVTADTAPRFLAALHAVPMTGEDVRALIESDQNEIDLLAFIDFDARRYIHSYYDLALEDYLPKGWHGALGDPRKALDEWRAKHNGRQS
jgi:hypothetical protein